MRVAIMGAGPAGLACAIALEKEGVDAVVFEEAESSGEIFTHAGLGIPVMERPLTLMLKPLKEEYGLALRPIRQINRFIMHGPTVTVQVTGKNLGLIWEKGRSPQSVTGQMLSLFRGSVLFNTRANYFNLSKDFDYVVVATGNREVPAMLGLWQDWFRSWVIGAQILGEFDPFAAHIWFNTPVDNHGYGYLVPFNERLATLNLIVKNVNLTAAQEHWRLFLEKCNIPAGRILYSYAAEHVTGYVYPFRLGNTFFAGISAALLDAFLGFGLDAAWLSGLLVARSIVRGGSYQQALEPVRRLMLSMLSLRRAFDRLDNNGIDRLVSVLELPGVREILYHSSLDVPRTTAIALDLLRRWRTIINPGLSFDYGRI